MPVIASGGVASLEHLTRLTTLGVEGAIVGVALYRGAFTLPEALAAVQDALELATIPPVPKTKNRFLAVPRVWRSAGASGT